MADYAGSIRVNTELNTRGITSGLARIEAQMNKTARRIEAVKSQMADMRNVQVPTDQYKALESELHNLETQLTKLTQKEQQWSEIGVSEKSGAMQQLYQQEADVSDKIDEIRSKMQSLTESGGAFKDPTQEAGYQKLLEQLNELQEQYGVLQIRHQEEMNKTASSAARVKNVLDAVGRTLSTLGAIGKKVFTILANGARKMASAAANTASAMGTRLMNAAKGTLVPLQSLGRGIDNFRKRILRLAASAFIFNLMSQGFREITQSVGRYIDAYAAQDAVLQNSITSLKAALSGIGGAFASAFAPIINAVVPYLVTLCSWLASAINLLGMFFAKLTGAGTYKRVVADNNAVAASMLGTSKAANKAGDAAKKAANNLAKFDELDVLNNNKSGSGGGGAGGAAAGTHMEEVPIDLPSEQDILDKFKGWMESIPWPQIQSEAFKMGKKLADILNTVFADETLAHDIGATIGQMINTALWFAYGFLTEFDFTQFGRWLGIAWNAIVETINWGLLAQDITLALNGAVEALRSFFYTISATAYDLGTNLGNVFAFILSNFNFSNLAQAIIEAANDVNLSLRGFNDSVMISIDAMAANFIAGMNTLIYGMRINADGTASNVWAENGTEIGRLIQNFAALIGQDINGIDWLAFGRQIATWLNNAIRQIRPETMASILYGIINAVADSVYSFVSTLDWDALSNDLQTFVKGCIQNIKWDEIGQAFHDLFKNALETLGSADWTGLAVKIIGVIGDALMGAISGLFSSGSGQVAVALVAGFATLKGCAPLMEKALSGAFGHVFDGLIESAGGVGAAFAEIGTKAAGMGLVFGGVIAVVKSFIDQWTNGFSLAKAAVLELGTVIAAIGLVILGVAGWPAVLIAAIAAAAVEIVLLIKTHWQEIVDFFTEAWAAFAEAWSAFWQGVANFLASIWTNILVLVTTAFSAVSSFIQVTLGVIQAAWTTTWNAVKSFLLSVWNGMKNIVSTTFNAIKAIISTVLTAINTLWTTVWTAVKSFAAPIWNWIQTTVVNVFKKIESGIGAALNNIKQKWMQIWGDMKDFLRSAVNGIIGFVNGMINAVVGAVNAVIGAINKLSFNVPSWVPGIGGSHFGFSLSTVSAPHVPMLADGAVIRGGNPFVAVLGDQPTGQTNIETPLSTMVEAFREALAESGSSGINTVVLSINGQELAEATLNDFTSVIQRRGITSDVVFGS